MRQESGFSVLPSRARVAEGFISTVFGGSAFCECSASTFWDEVWKLMVWSGVRCPEWYMGYQGVADGRVER